MQLMLFFTFLMFPIISVFQSGGVVREGSYFSHFTIGKLGESTVICKQANLMKTDVLDLACPMGTTLKVITEFGL